MKNQIKSGVLYIFLLIFCNVKFINNINAQYLQKLGGSSKVYEYGNTDLAKIGIGLINPTAKFQIKTNLIDNIPFKVEAKITKYGIVSDFGTVEYFSTSDDIIYGIYQTTTSGNEALNYFQSPTRFNSIKISADQYHAGMNMDCGVEDFVFSMRESPSGPLKYPLRIISNGIRVYEKTTTNEFQLLTDPGEGKVLVCDESGNGSWTDASSFHDDDWLITSKGKLEEPPPALDFQSIYLNTDKYESVLIGTDTPVRGYKLAVYGNIICEELDVKLKADWPDYVLSKNYKLPSLEKTETFINENGRLPGVPSAQEVHNKGVRVGEMNAILLEKVEELTLYVISLKKEIDQLKANAANK